MTLALLVALAAAAGGTLRWWIAGRLDGSRAWPLGTWLVNLGGSGAIGLMGGATSAGSAGLDPVWLVVAVAGLGSFTTVSAFGLQTLLLWRVQRGHALSYAAATMVLCPLAAALGYLAVA